MGYDRGDSFPFDFEPNGIPFVSKSKGKLSPRSYPIKYERKWKHSFLGDKNCSLYIGLGFVWCSQAQRNGYLIVFKLKIMCL